MDYFLDIIGAVFAADLVAASLTGKFVSIGRGGGKNITPVRKPPLRLALTVVALCILVFIAVDIRHKLGR